jgi:hypothetical protein
MTLSKEWLRMGEAIRLENNSGESVLNPLKFICDIMRCSEENRIGIVKTGTDESTGYK